MNYHCVKRFGIRSYSRLYFPAFRLNTEICSKLIIRTTSLLLTLSKSPYSVQIWENADQKNSGYGHFCYGCVKIVIADFPLMIHQINMCSKDVHAVWFVWWGRWVVLACSFIRIDSQSCTNCALWKIASEKEIEVKISIEKTSCMV